MIKDPGRLAWTVLITSFIIFCLLSTGIFAVIRWFLLDSSIPLTVTLHVARNTVTVRTMVGDAVEEAERGVRPLPRNVRLATDSASQGYITFTDSYTQVEIASVVLHHDSVLTLLEANQPRFEFSQNRYVIWIEDIVGEIDIEIAPDINREILLDVASPLGDMRMSQSGKYLINSQVDQLSVWNRAGRVIAISQNAEFGRDIPEGQQGHIVASATEIRIDQTLVDILPDSNFDDDSGSQELSSEWGCYTEKDDPNSPDGTYAREVLDDTPVMHISRYEMVGQAASNHGEIGCYQWPNTFTDPLPITAYNYLELRASMMILFQSLPMCGERGSECPVMLKINYETADGSQHSWIHGFYARFEQASGYPLRCDSCSLEHERLTPNTWYTFSSGNLLQLLPTALRPVAILNVGFYASGHQFEVLLGEVSLLAGNVNGGSASTPIEPTPTPPSTDEPTPAASPTIETTPDS